MTNTKYATAEAAQTAFYEAIERADLTRMMAIWSAAENIVCIHPGGTRHCGPAQVHESWRQIFLQGPQLNFSLADGTSHQQGMISIHGVCEQISHRSGAHPPVRVIATNVFVHSDDGWKMLIHHASQIPGERLIGQPTPSVLH